ncbi:PD-(D/E)XK nuclease domain-containing protein [Roseococcus microcysteis]|uniref:PD-(D/E)XK nuclease domain-containing protein n=1 Tax=Roseococcus microcysteis TaxID=2771361 RepID=UPI00168C0B2B|nr:hypothetical protein [Roseococcus microcysteis]
MNTEKAIEVLHRQRENIIELKKSNKPDSNFTKWHRDTSVAIERIFGKESRHVADFAGINYSLRAFSTRTPEWEFTVAYHRGLANAEAVLSSMSDELNEYGFDDKHITDMPDCVSLIERLCLRFHAVVRQLQQRHNDRETIVINDEYDVQDLLHALLRLNFDDVRAEEYAPSYAGGSSRIDFLLKSEKIVIEVKKTRSSLRQKEIGEQLIVDRARYEGHPDCKLLVCFVYDPEGRIGNPVGIERDLESYPGTLKVRVIIAPKA